MVLQGLGISVRALLVDVAMLMDGPNDVEGREHLGQLEPAAPKGHGENPLAFQRRVNEQVRHVPQ